MVHAGLWTSQNGSWLHICPRPSVCWPSHPALGWPWGAEPLVEGPVTVTGPREGLRLSDFVDGLRCVWCVPGIQRGAMPSNEEINGEDGGLPGGGALLSFIL